jgi:hypothetical protein
MSSITPETCLHFIEAATKQCQANVAPIASVQAPPPSLPDLNPLMTAFAGLSNSIAFWGSIATILIAIVTLFGGVLYYFVASHKTEKQAREIAEKYVGEWLSTKAPIIIREYLDKEDNIAISKMSDDGDVTVGITADRSVNLADKIGNSA